MPENLETRLQRYSKYRSRGILIDSNLLLLFLIGLASRDLIESFKETANQGWTKQDFDQLCRIIGYFKKVATTPHVLTEVSNHAARLRGGDREKFCAILRHRVEDWEENHSEASELVNNPTFINFGLTDTAIEHVAAGKFLVITVDLDLANHLTRKKVDVLNYNHIRLRYP